MAVKTDSAEKLKSFLAADLASLTPDEQRDYLRTQAVIFELAEKPGKIGDHIREKAANALTWREEFAVGEDFSELRDLYALPHAHRVMGFLKRIKRPKRPSDTAPPLIDLHTEPEPSEAPPPK